MQKVGKRITADKVFLSITLVSILILCLGLLYSCSEASPAQKPAAFDTEEIEDTPMHDESADDKALEEILPENQEADQDADKPNETDKSDEADKQGNETRPGVGAPEIIEDFRTSLAHGSKPAAYQKYIVLHDTEGESDPQSVVDWWASNGSLVAAHFVVGKDGTIVQCVPLDSIAHHAGFGDTGNNVDFGVEDESRDDKLGTVDIGSWASDYGMNSFSVGIEMVHVGGSGEYPKAQLEAVDALIAYIDNYYGFASTIIDHKEWRTGNSDTSSEFASYLASYKIARKHAG